MHTDSARIKNGFTLVEMAIVIVVIGLLIGGVLKGQYLISKAQSAALVKQIESYEAATKTFTDIYDQKPGDMVTATNRLPGCTAVNSCFNGNGGWTIGPNATKSVWVNEADPASPTDEQMETIMFWKHLVMADLVSGVVASSDSFAPAWGETHPAARWNGGGFHVVYVNQNWYPNTSTGHFVRLQSPVNRQENPILDVGTLAISPATILLIDEKLDDGDLTTGFIFAEGAACDGSNTNWGKGKGGANSQYGNNCNAWFKVD